MTSRSSALLLSALLILPAVSVSAQDFAAAVTVRGGRVNGRVVITSPAYRPIYEPRPHPPAPRVLVLAPAPRLLVVERVGYARGWGHGRWHRHGYREVVVYYDPSQDRYFTDLQDCRGFKKVVVYQREGRYYLPG